MDHNNCRENLSAYLDGELPAIERGLVEAHLADCPDCRAALGQLRSVSGLVKKHVMEPVPAALEKKVLDGAAPARPWLKPALAFSAAAAAVLVVFNLNKAPENAYSPDLSFGSRAEMEPAPAASESEAVTAAPMAPAAAPAAANSAALPVADKGYARPAALAAVRGSIGQAKFAARTASPASAGAGGSAFSSGYKAGAASEALPAAFTGPVCVYVSEPGVLREADQAMVEALAFLRKTCPELAQAAPGVVFIKKDGSRSKVSARACSYGFILFDGVQDPLVITDHRAVPAEYKKYFGLPR